MPRRQNDTPEEQDRKSKKNRNTSINPEGKKCAVPSKVKKPTSKMNMNNRNKSSTATTRPTAVVPPHNITSSKNTLPSTSNAATVNVVASALSATPRITRPPFDESLGDRENDDVIYLYTIAASSARRAVEVEHLEQESKEEGKPVPTEKKQTDAKSQKSQKRKAEGDEVSNKRSAFRNEPVCSVCNAHYDSLNDNAERMLIFDCGHLICQPCSREIEVNECQVCGQKFKSMRKVFL